MRVIAAFLLFIKAAPTVAFIPPSAFSPTRSWQKQNTAVYTAEAEDDHDMNAQERKVFDEIAEKFLSDTNDNNDTDFPSAFPTNPFKTSLGETGGKDALYSDDELFSVLTLHEELSENLNDQEEKVEDVSGGAQSQGLPGIHDLVMNALQNVDGSSPSASLQKEPFVGMGMTSGPDFEIDEDMKQRMTKIRAIASDVDGTILTSKMTIHPRTRLAITRAIKMAGTGSDAKIQHFFPATGKSRKGALDSLGIEVGNLIEQNCAGVYLQGLFCVDPDGNVVFERKLDLLAIDAAEALVKESGISIVGYDGDNLFTTDQTDIVIHLHEHYGEPLPVLLPQDNDDAKVRNLSTHAPSMHKLILMDDDCEKLANVVRPKMEALAEKYNASVTQALPTMLELLPKGCSKALGVEKVCEALGIDPSAELLALGDAENDAGMLDMASIGIAVGNASPPARKASDLVLDYTNDEGGVGFAIEWFALDS